MCHGFIRDFKCVEEVSVKHQRDLLWVSVLGGECRLNPSRQKNKPFVSPSGGRAFHPEERHPVAEAGKTRVRARRLPLLCLDGR